MEALKIIAVNYIMLAELAGLWAMLDAGVHNKKRTVIVTKIVILLILLEAILWSLEQWTQTFTRLSLGRPFLTASIYLLHPIIMICILQMVEMVKKKEISTLDTDYIKCAVILFIAMDTCDFLVQ